METKICSKCKERKPLEEFFKDKRASTGYTSYCKKCSRIAAKEWIKKNKEKVFEQNKKRVKKWRSNKDNIEKANAMRRKYYKKNKHKYREINKLNYQKNHDKILKENQKRTIDLADRYIKNSLIRSGWDKTKLNPDVIEEKRNIIKVIRIIKKIKNKQNYE